VLLHSQRLHSTPHARFRCDMRRFIALMPQICVTFDSASPASRLYPSLLTTLGPDLSHSSVQSDPSGDPSTLTRSTHTTMAEVQDQSHLEEVKKLTQERAALFRQLYQYQAQLDGQSTLNRRSDLTLRELQTMPDDVVTFRVVGRMFMKDDVNKIKSDIHTLIEDSSASIAKLEAQKKATEKRIAEIEAELKELIEK